MSDDQHALPVREENSLHSALLLLLLLLLDDLLLLSMLLRKLLLMLLLCELLLRNELRLLNMSQHLLFPARSHSLHP